MRWKYAALGGTVRSSNDGQTHHIPATGLARLYGLPDAEVLVIKKPPHGQRLSLLTELRRLREAPLLIPDPSGRYQVGECPKVKVWLFEFERSQES